MPRPLEQTLAVITIDEVLPRAARHGHFPDPLITGLLARAEYEGHISRHRVRQLLEELYG